MIRRAIAIALFAAPAAIVCAMPGCGDEPLPQDLCNWLRDTNNCYARFANDVGTVCGYEFVAGNDPLQSATGFFQARDALDICVKNEGGQVIFDPPLDLTMFPLESIGFTVLDFQANECGVVMMTNIQTYSVTINPIDIADAGQAQLDQLTPGEDGQLDSVIGGTFSSTKDDGRNRQDVACPGGTESHNFNTLLLNKCPEVAPFEPRAIIESSPGLAETSANPSTPGFVRFRIEYPPVDINAEGAQPRVIEYFNCLIPAPPPPCQDEVKNNTETDIDCGGDCPTKCAEGQSCLVNEDCTSSNCGLNGGFRQCLP